MRILLLNPNLTQAVTESCAAAARAVASAGTEIVSATGDVGAQIINSRAENALAAQTVLTLASRHAGDVDAVLLAVSYDTALYPARRVARDPCRGDDRGSDADRADVGSRFGLVVFGTPWLYREHVAALGLSARFAGLRSIDRSAASVYSDPDSVRSGVIEAARALVAEEEADVVILCGAAMAGMARQLQAQVDVPLLDGVSCAVPLCEMLVRMKLPPPGRGSFASARGRQTAGLDPALEARLARS